MKITALRLSNVKRFAGRGVAIENIQDGVNVLCAANEFGKSTSFEALHALFFQPHTGTASDVQKLRPYAGGSPRVEADIEVGDQRYRISKQYYAGRSARIVDLNSGRLLAQADEAENFIARLIKDGTSGPAGLLWVRQGVTGIEKRSSKEEEADKQIRASLLESVQGEVEAITGGKRMADIITATNESLSELVTATGKPKAGGRFQAAKDECDRLTGEERQLAGEVEQLRAALDKRSQANRRLDEISQPDERAGRRKAIETAQAAFDAAKSHNEALKTAQAGLELARERRDVVQRDLHNFKLAIEQAAQLQIRLTTAEQQQAEITTRRLQALEAIANAGRAAEAAELRERDLNQSLQRAEAAVKARDIWLRLEEKKARLTNAEALRQQMETGEARLALLKISAADIERLQKSEIECAKLRAIEDAARPSIVMDYAAAAAARIQMDGQELPGGEEQRYGEQAELTIPGIGRLTLRANRPQGSDNNLKQAEARYQALLQALQVASIAAAQAQLNEAQELRAQLGELRGRLSLLAPQGLVKLREEIAAEDRMAAPTGEQIDDPQQIRQSLLEAAEQRAITRQALREVEPLRGTLDESYLAIQKSLAGLNVEIAQINSQLGIEAERAMREQRLVENLGNLQQAFVAAEQQAQNLRAIAVDLDTAAAQLKRSLSVHEAVEQEINALRETISGLNAEIRARSDDAVEEKWRETTEALQAARTRLAAFEKEVAILQKLSSTLEQARSSARELYLKPVMSELKPLLRLMFDDASITFDDRTLLPQSISRNGLEEDIERLSGGMREQLSILTRLAFARLLAHDGKPAPVILDDALVYSDDDRIEKMFDALHRQATNQQIIVFSCRQRAFQKLGGNVLQMVDWVPDN